VKEEFANCLRYIASIHHIFQCVLCNKGIKRDYEILRKLTRKKVK